MTDLANLTRDHYQSAIDDEAQLLSRIDALVEGLGEGPKSATQLGGLDQFHVGGLGATAEFARRIGIAHGSRVMDAGCGFGGPARYLAETYGCEVVGVDLSPSYVAAARRLSEHSAVADRVRFEVGDLTALAAPASRFDLVVSQHAAMNIRDRAALYGEILRMLRPEGRFAFYDVLLADAKPEVLYPTPWARSSETSTLLTEGETKAALTDAGFDLLTWSDVSQEAVGWLAGQRAGPSGPGGPGLALGAGLPGMVANFGRNLVEGRVRLVMASFVAV